ncbi:hypothetical protein WJX73_000122 [Symbiochloris irregularis]|uniref:Uncharacterized protein n=1 Tax=Symbiochloris irregularis TaxID=706552 RepID=A0AAW1NXP3_9CHLO
MPTPLLHQRRWVIIGRQQVLLTDSKANIEQAVGPAVDYIGRAGCYVLLEASELTNLAARASGQAVVVSPPSSPAAPLATLRESAEASSSPHQDFGGHERHEGLLSSTLKHGGQPSPLRDINTTAKEAQQPTGSGRALDAFQLTLPKVKTPRRDPGDPSATEMNLRCMSMPRQASLLNRGLKPHP